MLATETRIEERCDPGESHSPRERAPRQTMLAAEAEHQAYTSTQPETITGKLAKDITQQACARWHLKQAQWYEWQKRFGKPQKTEDGLMLSAEQVAVFDCLRSHLDNGGTYASYKEQLDKERCDPGESNSPRERAPREMVREAEATETEATETEVAEIIPASTTDIQIETDEGEFVQVESKRDRPIPRAIQEQAFLLRATEYRLAANLSPEQLDPDLQEALKREEDNFVGKLNRRRSPEEMEGAIASMMNLLAA